MWKSYKKKQASGSDSGAECLFLCNVDAYYNYKKDTLPWIGRVSGEEKVNV